MSEEDNAPFLGGIPPEEGDSHSIDEEKGSTRAYGSVSMSQRRRSPFLAIVKTLLPILISLAVFIFFIAIRHRVAEFLKPPKDADIPKGALSEQAGLAAARCLAIFLAVVVLWATGAVPLYVTALSVVPLTVLLRVFLDEQGQLLTTEKAADHVVHAMGNDAVFMVIGVYSLGAALGKTNFEHIISRALFSVATSSLRLLAVVMLLAVLISMVVSNVFAPVLLISILTPLFHSLDTQSYPLVRSIILGISVASNIGGMPSPISSPQNIVALALLRDKGGINFLTWIAATIPQCIVMLVIGYALIVLRFRTYRYSLNSVDCTLQNTSITVTDFLVFGCFAVTILLWVVPVGSTLFGHAGIVSLLPVVFLFGTGILETSDFKNLPWNVIYLVAGGIAMGSAIESSHLLTLAAHRLYGVLQKSSLWFAVGLVVLFMAVVAEGISHTVSAIIVLPLVEHVGARLGHPRLLVMAGVIACSGAMSLPVSSFPNMSAFGVLDPMGAPYLAASDILISGLPMTVACCAVISTIGFFIMSRVLGL